VRTSLFTILTWVWLAQPAWAAMAQPVSVETLTRQSDAVVRAKVEKQKSYWTADGRRIYTLVTLSRSAVWKGAVPERLVVQVPGGQVGDLVQRVDAAPTFSDAGEVVLFLARGAGGRWKVREMGLGKFAVQEGQAHPSAGSIEFTKGDVPAGERLVESMSLQELKSRVKAAAGSRP
jgi:hypothetical protein